MRGDELEMLDHRMRAVATELADHAQHHGLGLRALELDLALAEIGFDAVELAEEIVVPKGAAKLAVGHGTKPRFLLLADHGLDLAVFDRLEFFGGDLAALALGARLLEGGGTQEAPDMIGAKRRLGAWHDGSVFRENCHRPRRRAIQSSPLVEINHIGRRLLDAPPSRGMTTSHVERPCR